MKATWTLWMGGLIVASALAGCTGDMLDPSEETNIVSADDTATSTAEITASYPVGSTLVATADLNLRTGPSTGNSVILVMPNGSTMTLVETSPRAGWYHVQYGSHTGWASGTYLRVTSSSSSGSGSGTGTGSGSSGSAAMSTVFERAAAGVGFAYWWGHGTWLASGPTSSTQSSCSGSCPSCSHSGRYGADCSGFVAKVWSVPRGNESLSSDYHPYNSGDFAETTGGGQWSAISRSNLRHGDALAYHTGSAGHVFLVDSGDPWGSLWVYEAPGCASGGGRIHHTLRTASSAYRAIRRAGL